MMLLIATGVLGCGSASKVDLVKQDSAAVAQGDCPRPIPRGGAHVVLRSDNLPCQLEIEFTGVSLDSRGGPVPIPAPAVARDSRGRLFSSVTGDGGIAVWSPGGQFEGRLGRVGRGPGEFDPGWVFLFIDVRDNVYARDNSANWLLFDSTLAYVRSVRVPSIGFLGLTEMIEGGKFLSTRILRESGEMHKLKEVQFHRGDWPDFGLSLGSD